ncbi:MAG: phosphoribosylformylglycinamidine cyclo-ligase [Candidatus Coatesbacteria bacterium]|nr:phosphoribosylformylglycinamidine cyclo-ligase [Candidatus Coatesbacteria bacterium]
MPGVSNQYDAAGVNTEMIGSGLSRLRSILSGTFEFNDRSKPVTDLSFFAALLDIGIPEYIAICTDNVGTKLLVAQMMDKYDTVGIDCVAVNVNDVICVGAEPLTFVNYLALQEPDPDFLESIAKGLYEGAKLANVSISGGESAAVGQLIAGVRPNRGFDFSGTCIGIVHRDKVIVGRDVVPGDAILSLSSSGLHSNGYSLARKILFETMNFGVDTYVKELGKTAGEELLMPTHIYVREILEIINGGLPIKALVNITGNGLLNLNRIAAKGVGFEINALPEPAPIFSVLQEWGDIDDAEMFRVFNMSMGFCIIVPDDSDVIAKVGSIASKHGVSCSRIGTIVEDKAKRVFITQKGLKQEGLFFVAD